VEMARLLAARRGDPVRIEGVTDPSDPDRDRLESGFAAGWAGGQDAGGEAVESARLGGPDAIHAGPTFAEWLASAPADAEVPRWPAAAGEQ
jgi:hypothetical protein